MFNVNKWEKLITQNNVELDSKTEIKQLELAAIKTTQLFSDGVIEFSESEKGLGRFVSSSLSRLTQELFGFCACMRNGSFLGSFHHIRAILENCSGIKYMFKGFPSDKRFLISENRDQRLKKYFKFESVAKYNYFKKISRFLDCECNEEQIKNATGVSKEYKDKFISSINDEIMKDWCSLFKPVCRADLKLEEKVKKIQHWHCPFSISNIIELVIEDIPTPFVYSHLSMLTHVTPFQNKTTDDVPILFGLPNGLEKTVVHIGTVKCLTLLTLKIIDEAQICNFSLLNLC